MAAGDRDMPGLGIDREDLTSLSRTVHRLGGYAEGLFEFHDFGFERTLFRDHVTSVCEMLRGLRDASGGEGIPLHPPGLPAGAFWEDPVGLWNHLQTLRFAAGAAMISEGYRHRLTPENLRRALTAKILHKCQIGILDDLIDRGTYTYLEAKELHHLVLSSMIDPEFDAGALTQRVVSLLRQNQLPLFELIHRIAGGFNTLWNGSPNGPHYFYQMEVLDERVALGQALSMFQIEGRLNVPRMARIAKSFHAPGADLTWWEKLGAHISSTGRYNFIDMAFADTAYDLESMRTFLDGWYYFDTAIILMDHIVSIHDDLRDGIANLSLIGMREGELGARTSLKGYNPRLTPEEYRDHLRRIAHLTSKGLRLVTQDLRDEMLYFPFLTIMMPVILMADWIGNRDELLHDFLDRIAPDLRRVAADRAVGSHALQELAVATIR